MSTPGYSPKMVLGHPDPLPGDPPSMANLQGSSFALFKRPYGDSFPCGKNTPSKLRGIALLHPRESICAVPATALSRG